MAGIVATAEIEIAADQDRVWSALTEPDQIKEYMFGSDVQTDWQPGSDIRWKGEYQGKPYEDRGKIVSVDVGQELVVTHYSPLSGQDDVPENYHTLTYRLEGDESSTTLTLTQDNNSSPEEADQNAKNWTMMLDGLKSYVEGG